MRHLFLPLILTLGCAVRPPMTAPSSTAAETNGQARTMGACRATWLALATPEEFPEEMGPWAVLLVPHAHTSEMRLSSTSDPKVSVTFEFVTLPEGIALLLSVPPDSGKVSVTATVTRPWDCSSLTVSFPRR